MQTIPFKFSLLPGDLINALPGMREVCRKMNRRADIYLGLNIEWQMTTQIAEGRLNKITLTEKTMAMLRPLLLSQPWINKVESLEAVYPEKYNKWCDAFASMADPEYAQKWYNENQDEMIDLDKHHVMPIKLQFSNIFRWNFYCYYDMTCDLSEPWLSVGTLPSPWNSQRNICINRTKRSQNSTINYKFLKQYEDRLFFIGYQDEWVDFTTMYDLNFPRLPINDFLEMAIAIRSSAFFIGNQSIAFSIAEALKVPRVLEVCPYLPNVIPAGRDGFDILFQSSLEGIVKYLAERRPLPTKEGYKNDPYSQTE